MFRTPLEVRLARAANMGSKKDLDRIEVDYFIEHRLKGLFGGVAPAHLPNNPSPGLLVLHVVPASLDQIINLPSTTGPSDAYSPARHSLGMSRIFRNVHGVSLSNEANSIHLQLFDTGALELVDAHVFRENRIPRSVRDRIEKLVTPILSVVTSADLPKPALVFPSIINSEGLEIPSGDPPPYSGTPIREKYLCFRPCAVQSCDATGAERVAQKIATLVWRAAGYEGVPKEN